MVGARTTLALPGLFSRIAVTAHVLLQGRHLPPAPNRLVRNPTHPRSRIPQP